MDAEYNAEFGHIAIKAALCLTTYMYMLIGIFCTAHSTMADYIQNFNPWGRDRTLYACNGRALDRVTTQKHRPNRQKIVQKMSENCVFSPSRQLLDIFRTFCRHFSDILSAFPLGCPNALPVTIVCACQGHNSKTYNIMQKSARKMWMDSTRGRFVRWRRRHKDMEGLFWQRMMWDMIHAHTSSQPWDYAQYLENKQAAFEQQPRPPDIIMVITRQGHRSWQCRAMFECGWQQTEESLRSSSTC